ncbi:MAG: hypothetical protein KDA71_14680 [Planctomycetales bacterium]|nr:hypothetical protein [Planctomycetales bacterium]
MKTTNVIRDGFTRSGYIKPIELLHQGLEFTYRPMLPEDTLRLEREIDQVAGEDAGGEALAIANSMANYVREWSEVDEKGKPLPVSMDAMRRLPLPLLRRVHYIVAGVQASDVKPSESENAEAGRTRLRELQAIATGQPPGQVTLEEQLGNSVAG